MEFIYNIFHTITQNQIGQILGFFGMFGSIIAFIQKDDYKVRKFMLISSFFWGVHFYMLEAYSWLAITCISATRTSLSVKYNKNKYVFLFVVTLALISGIYTYQEIYSLIPIVISLMWAYGFFYLSHIRLRLLMISSSSLWICYSLIIGSVSVFFNNVLTISILLTTIYRMIEKNKFQTYWGRIHERFFKWKRYIDYDIYISLNDIYIKGKNRFIWFVPKRSK